MLSRYNNALQAKPLLVTAITTGFCYGAGDVVAQSIERNNDKKKNYDLQRFAVMVVFGTFLGGPIYYYWFSKIDKMPRLIEKLVRWNEKRNLVQHFARELNTHMAKNSLSDMSMKKFRLNYKSNFDTMQKPLIRSKTILVAKIYADQFIFSPLYIVFFMMSTGVMMDMTDSTREDDFSDRLKFSLRRSWESLKKKFVNIYVTDCAIWPLVQMANFAFVPAHLQPIFVNIVNVGWNAFLSYASLGH
jgi:protein Mpv17